MKPVQAISRNALVWIIFSLFTLVVPHVTRIPVWVLGVYVFAASWRALVYQGRWSFPGRWVKALLILGSFGGIYFSYGSLLGLEPTVALLLTAFALKLIELVQRKDAYVLLFLGYFICLTEFLFSQDLLLVLYSLFNVTVVTTGLVALHRPGEHQFNRKAIRLAGVMLLQALPLMVVLFFLFPRIGPLWTVPIKSHAAKTGISDFMKPGDISRLSQSDEVAFRAQFEREIPAQSELYWRGLVLSRLEEGAWRSLSYYEVPALERRPFPVDTQGDPLGYRIIMAPTQQHWLYSLRFARSTTPGVMATGNYVLYSPVEVEDEYLYQVQSWPQANLETTLSDWRRETELALPALDNPRTVALAMQMRGGVDSDEAMVDAVLSRFRNEPYHYTLQPPLLPAAHPVDAFLFETLRGFCEHYAYAFVVMMRAAGVPARVVAGYQGGEINPVNKTVIVHQFDAHAWAEVWLQGQGWVRVDPTAAVAPARIEWGLEQAMAAEGSFLRGSPLSPLRYRSVAWLNMLRLRFDAVTYGWQSWVLGFNSDQQFRLWQQVVGEVSARKFATVLLGAGALFLVPVAISLLRRGNRHRLSTLDRYFLLFCKRLSRAGIIRNAGETPTQFAARVSRAVPASAAGVEAIARLYVQLSYADGGLSPSQQARGLRLFRQSVRRFRLPKP